MKTNAYWQTLLVSAALITQTQAHGFGGRGASSGGGHAMMGHAPAASAYHVAPARTFATDHAMYANRYATYNPGAFANRFARNQAAYINSPRNVATANRGHYLPSHWRDHVYAWQSANWHRDWDRSRVHWWNSHRCRFINGGWVIFDGGFDPWWYWPYSDFDYENSSDGNEY